MLALDFPLSPFFFLSLLFLSTKHTNTNTNLKTLANQNLDFTTDFKFKNLFFFFLNFVQYWHKTQVDQTSSNELISSYHNNNDKNKVLQQGNQQETRSKTRIITRTPTRILDSSSSSQISKQDVQAYKSLNKLSNNNNNNYK